MASRRLADAMLAAGALVGVLLAAGVLGVRADSGSLVAGGAGALVLEFGLHRHQQTVRAYWDRTAVKVLAVVLFLAVVALAAVVAPARGLSLLAGGLVGYLAILAGDAIGTAAASRRSN